MNTAISRHLGRSPRLATSASASAKKANLPSLRPHEKTAPGPGWSMPAHRAVVHSATRNIAENHFAFEPFLQKPNGRMSGMIAPLLPEGVTDKPMLLETEVLPGMHLMIGATGKLSSARPGNGGFRIWKYDNKQDAAAEAVALAQGMEVKHMVYNTGCAGAKVVCNIGDVDIKDLDKKTLLDALNKVLVSLDGAMYTGCDLNSTLDDMAYLADKSPYILAAIGNDKVDPNHATAHGVVGAIIAALRNDLVEDCDGATVVFNGAEACQDASQRISSLLAGKKLLVHGCGAVGSVVAQELSAMGASVMTIDATPERADIPGCTNISGTEKADAWWSLPVDAIVPCSASGLITKEMIEAMRTKNIVGASNLPFATAATQKFAELQHQICFVPEGITSAGAVIVDSVEQFDNDAFADALPDELYAFCRQQVFKKTGDLIHRARESNAACISEQLPHMLESQNRAAEQGGAVPIGNVFRSWSKKKATAPATAAAVRDAFNDMARASLLLNQKKALKTKMTAAASSSSSSSSSSAGSVGASMSAAGAPGSGVRGFASAPAHTKADVVICGGGIMGLNVAYQLKCRDPAMKVLVLEKAAALGHGSSGWSTGFMRAFYSFDETMRLALDGINAYKNWADYTGLGKETRAYFTETGALWMLGKTAKENEEMKVRLQKFGVESEVLDAQGVKAKFPAMDTEPYPEYNMETGEETGKKFGELSALYEVGCGHLDSSSCLEDMLDACKREGVEYKFNTQIKGVSQAGGKVTGVTLADGSEIAAGVVVNCMGPWHRELNATAGVTTSTTMLPTRIQVGHIAIEKEEHLSLPFTADQYGASGIYYMPRRANKQLVFGSIDHRFESEVVENPDELNTTLDNHVEADYLGCLMHRLPGLPKHGKVIGFSSMYTVNQEDVHPVVGQSSLAGYYLCNGFSGHGFKLSPAVGAMMAQQIMGSKAAAGSRMATWETTAPLDFLAANREPLALKVKTHFA